MNLKWIKIVFLNILLLVIILKLIDPLFSSTGSRLNTDYFLQARTNPINLNITLRGGGFDKNNIEVKLITNNEGYIIGETPRTSKRDIFFIGGSTVQNLFIESEFRYPELIQKKFPNEINIYNSGTPSQNTFQSNILLLTKILSREIRPEMIFFQINLNDIILLTRSGSYWKDSSSTASFINKSKGKFDNKIIDSLYAIKNYLFPNIWSIFNKSIMEFRIEKGLINKYDIWTYDKNTVLSEFRSQLNMFVKICQAYQIKPVLMTEPIMYDKIPSSKESIKRIGIQEIKYFHERFNKIISEVSEEYSIDFVDLKELIPPKKENFVDFIHLSKEGNRKVYLTLSEYLNKHFETK